MCILAAGLVHGLVETQWPDHWPATDVRVRVRDGATRMRVDGVNLLVTVTVEHLGQEPGR